MLNSIQDFRLNPSFIHLSALSKRGMIFKIFLNYEFNLVYVARMNVQ